MSHPVRSLLNNTNEAITKWKAGQRKEGNQTCFSWLSDVKSTSTLPNSFWEEVIGSIATGPTDNGWNVQNCEPK
jgi:alpha-amylase/alpha-mannosidase (GH57 family)